MQVSEIDLYELLKGKLGEKEAKAVVGHIAIVVNNKYEEKKGGLVTIEDKSKLLTKDDAYKIFATKEDLANVKVDIIRWIFAFWITLTLAIVGLYFKG